jgi:hypothetical protein
MNVRRFPQNPIIRPHMDTRMGENINGPSLIRVPAWVERPLGKYYLYFGHHQGKYIRLAYADALEGPWRTHEPGVLDLADSFFVKHLASPDLLVDDDRRELRLYYHGPQAERDRQPGQRYAHHSQATRVALSRDGLRFEPRDEVLGAPYMRVFRWQGWYYGIGMPGILHRSHDGLADFEEGHTPFDAICDDMRHCALDLDEKSGVLTVYYTNRGDCPERILRTTIDLKPDWREWAVTPPELVLEPELDYEGVNAPHVPSHGGAIHEPAYQLRDPYIFHDSGRRYLLYSVAGERGLALSELQE